VSIDTGLHKSVSVASATAGAYCLNTTIGNQNWSVAGPGAAWHKNLTCAAPTVSVNA
jgi:hypothetical protein